MASSLKRRASLVLSLVCPTVLGLAALLGRPADAAAPPPTPVTTKAASPAFEKITLANGLEAVLVEDRRVPRVAIEVGYRVGVRDDPKGRRGMAMLMGRLLEDASTRHMSRFERTDMLRALGAPPTISTIVRPDRDVTQCFTSVPSNALDLALWIEAERMGFARDGIDKDQISSHASAVADKFEKDDEDVLDRLFERVRSALYGPDHPYGGERGDYLPPELDSVTQKEVLEQLAKYYGPSNATLVITGHFDKTHVAEVLQAYFGTLASTGPRAPKGPAFEPKPPASKKLLLEADIARPLVVLAWPTPPLFSPDDIALDVLASVLRERLNKRLIQEKKAATDVFTRQASNELGSYFYLAAACADGHPPSESLALLEEEVQRISTTDPTPDETTSAGTSFAVNLAFGFEDLTSRTDSIDDFLRITGDAGYFEKYFSGYAGARPEDVRRVAVKWLSNERRLFASVTPNPNAPLAPRPLPEGKP